MYNKVPRCTYQDVSQSPQVYLPGCITKSPGGGLLKTLPMCWRMSSFTPVLGSTMASLESKNPCQGESSQSL
ncbi:hypothetical protein DPMN_024571 [Dreissena polymorpha]|uniref:Uncharacterized protein n=1 Tax=Dreissena polymorpha TaxID=45954 RepID=A0A9D4LMR8_DREPO|nr:hypothetical protein DPMN_024571 [Dreissena polymorpha]